MGPMITLPMVKLAAPSKAFSWVLLGTEDDLLALLVTVGGDMTGRGHDVGDLLGSMLDIMLGTMLGSPGMSLAALSTSLRMLTGLESSAFHI